jgi:O-6-methylguanine DNA methyltransferase
MTLQTLLCQIPKGKVTTYGALALKLGTSPRAVGAMLAKNDPKKAPCYKVVMSDGRLGGYSGPGGVARKAQLLKQDGILIKGGRVIGTRR